MTAKTRFKTPLCTTLALTATLVAGAAAAQDALFVDSSGRVGIGTNDPGGNLHIAGGATEDVFNAVGPNASTNAFNFGYSGASFGSNSGFFNVRPGGTAPNPALYFATGNIERMIVDNQGFIGVHLDGTFGNGFNPSHPIESQTTGARLTAAGVWTNASSRRLKENIHPLSLNTALDALDQLQPVEFNYKVDPSDPQVGFIAEDVPDLVATPDRTGLAALDIVGVLTKVVQAQNQQLDSQRQIIENLTARLERLEKQTDF